MLKKAYVFQYDFLNDIKRFYLTIRIVYVKVVQPAWHGVDVIGFIITGLSKRESTSLNIAYTFLKHFILSFMMLQKKEINYYDMKGLL